MFESRAADLDLADVETALVRGAVGDYAEEAAVLLVISFGHWLPQLQAGDLITVVPDSDSDGLWGQIAWADLEPALADGRLVGGTGAVWVLRAAASIAEGHPVDLGDLAAGLDRPALTLLLAAIAHAAGSHDHWEPTDTGETSRTPAAGCLRSCRGPRRTERPIFVGRADDTASEISAARRRRQALEKCSPVVRCRWPTAWCGA